MKWREFKVIFEAPHPAVGCDLISELFYDIGARGVVVEDPGETPAGDWAPGETGVSRHHAVGAYFPIDADIERRQHRLRKGLKRLEVRAGILSRTVSRDLKEEDWAESWKAHFHPQRITERLTVKPSWRRYRPAAGEIVLEIDPGMAFGTGTHPSTALCLALMESYMAPGGDLLDLGTGSGILMLAAVRLGARRVVGVDNDPLAAGVARENLRRNGISTPEARLVVADLAAGLNGHFAAVTANILSPVILRLLDDLGRLLVPGGLFIGSGIVRENRSAVERKMRSKGFDLLEARTDGEWVALAGRAAGGGDRTGSAAGTLGAAEGV